MECFVGLQTDLCKDEKENGAAWELSSDGT
jgi:hypothetical protein